MSNKQGLEPSKGKCSRELADTIIHITMEQRVVYTQDYTRLLALTAVRKCNIRQEHINATSSIASLINNSASRSDIQLTNQFNHWRRKFYSQTLSSCTKGVQRLSGRNNKALLDSNLPKSNNSSVLGSRGNPISRVGETPPGRNRTSSAASQETKRKRNEQALRKKKKQKKAEADRNKLNSKRTALEAQLVANIAANQVVNAILNPQQQQ